MKGLIMNLKESLSALRDVVFMRCCKVCGRPLEADCRWICSECKEDIPYTYFWNQADNPARARLAQRFAVERAASLFFYRSEGGYAQLIHRFKYNRQKDVGRLLATELGRHMAEGGLFDDIDAVCAVPLHPLRRFRRGFNQSEIIALEIMKELSKADGHKVQKAFGLVRRNHYTRTQTRFSAANRAKNVSGAFVAVAKEVEKMKSNGVRHVLMVDDVLTSGSTMHAACAPLSEHFRISVATLGYVE